MKRSSAESPDPIAAELISIGAAAQRLRYRLRLLLSHVPRIALDPLLDSLLAASDLAVDLGLAMQAIAKYTCRRCGAEVGPGEITCAGCRSVEPSSSFGAALSRTQAVFAADPDPDPEPEPEPEPPPAHPPIDPAGRPIADLDVAVEPRNGLVELPPTAGWTCRVCGLTDDDCRCNASELLSAGQATNPPKIVTLPTDAEDRKARKRETDRKYAAKKKLQRQLDRAIGNRTESPSGPIDRPASVREPVIDRPTGPVERLAPVDPGPGRTWGGLRPAVVAAAPAR